MIIVEDMKMKNVCILDLDGTLVDTLDSLVISANKTMEEIGLPPITRSQCRDFIGNGARYLVEQSILSGCDECDEALLDKATEIYIRVFADHCMYQVVPYKGIPEVLDALKENGIRLAILSNKPHERTVEIAENYFGKGYFDYIQGQSDGVPRKPDPESMNYVIRKLGAKNENCIYVGDSDVDIITGKSANVATIGVSWGFRDRIVLEEAQATSIIDKPEELLACINHINQE